MFPDDVRPENDTAPCAELDKDRAYAACMQRCGGRKGVVDGFHRAAAQALPLPSVQSTPRAGS
jgi:hypothetical protein